jgi:hypothetical protein
MQTGLLLQADLKVKTGEISARFSGPKILPIIIFLSLVHFLN